MKIAIDAREIYRAERRGMGKSLLNLYTAMAELRPDWRFRFIHQLPSDCPEIDAHPAFSHWKVDAPGVDRLRVWESALLPAAALAMRANLLHSPANTGPRFAGMPRVVTIHDMIPVDLDPESQRTIDWLRRVQRVARGAKRILTPSRYSKDRIVALLKIPAERISVIPWASQPTMRHVTDPEVITSVKLKHQLQADDPYILSFGALEPRKNTEGLLRAYAGLPDPLRKQYRLLVIGITPSVLKQYQTLAASLELEQDAIIHGFADEVDLPALLSGATLLAFPSKSEGFGLPVLDAFECETAVLAGDRTSLPEVVGDAGLLVDPDSIDAIRDALLRMLQDNNLRNELVLRGKSRLVNYTWQQTAEATAQIFERIVRPTETTS